MSSYVGYRDAGKTNEQGLKEELNRLYTKGVAVVDTPTALAVSQRGAGANMSIDVAIGDAHLVIPSGLYSYWGWTDAVANCTVTAANVSNPRIDVVVAYVDLSVTSTSSSNNPGALKFSAIAGTPAGSPTAPSTSTIQAALGNSVPFIKLAQIAVAANATQVVNANLTDVRQPIAVKSRLWGGSNNTNGHAVPNTADDTVVLFGALTAANIGGVIYPINSIYIETSGTNPATTFGFGTWVAFAAGRTLIGNGISDQAFAAGTTGGESNHTLTVNELAVHAHGVNDSGHTHGETTAGGTGSVTSITGSINLSTSAISTPLSTQSSSTGITIQNGGGGASHNVLQPFIVVYFWKRTA